MPDGPTLETYLREWLELQRARLQPYSWRSYRGNVDRYLVPALGDRPLGELTVAEVETFLARLLTSGGVNGKPLSLRTVGFCHTVLRKALADAVRRGALTVNVADLAEGPRVDPHADGEPKVRTWTAGELRRFLDLTNGMVLHPLWRLAATTGMRRGELLALRGDDVDRDRAVVHVRRSMTAVDGRVTFKVPKGGRSRSLHIDERTLEALPEVAGAASVFDGDGGPLRPLDVTRAFASAVRAYDLPRIRFHDLRHTHATLLLEAGVPIKVVSERLGHASVSTTLDIYAHVMPAADSDAAARFSATVWGDDDTH